MNAKGPTDYISSPVEDALAACGRERVFHRIQGGASVAIRWDDQHRVTAPADGCERHLVRNGDTLDEAGAAAAASFAMRLREQARSLDGWAERIERHLKNRTLLT